MCIFNIPDNEEGKQNFRNYKRDDKKCVLTCSTVQVGL